MNYWLRLYTGILDDPKVQRLEAEHFRGWINLLCLAKEGDGLLPSVEDIAFRLRITEADAARLTEVLVERGLLDADGDSYKPHNWDKRQFVSDVSAETSKQYRERLAGDNAQVRSNYIYFIGTTIDRIVKIGVSKNPWARVVEFQTGSPEPLSVLATFRTDGRSEIDIHELLDEYRQHGEWFLLSEHIQLIVSVAAAEKQNYAQLVALLRDVLRSKSTELRSNDATDDYATTTESEYRAETEPEQSRGARDAQPTSRAKPRSVRTPVECDDAYLDRLQLNPAYSMLNVRLCYHRMVAWCEQTGKQPSRRRFINWLNREDKPMTGVGNGKHDATQTGTTRKTEEFGIRDAKLL